MRRSRLWRTDQQFAHVGGGYAAGVMTRTAAPVATHMVQNQPTELFKRKQTFHSYRWIIGSEHKAEPTNEPR
jgi:hypothetical protein